jgi:hypothetical protein
MKVIVPSSLSEIKLSQYLSYLEAVKESEKNDNKSFLDIKTLEIFCGLSLEEVLQIEYSFVSTISERIKEVLKQEPDLVEKFTIGDLKFGWIPKLDDLKYGEFIDLNSNISEWDTMIVAMGVLYRPIIKENKDGKYLVEDYKGDTYHDALMQMPMDAVVGAMVFFWNLGLDCTTYIMKHLETEMGEMTFQKQLNLVEGGVGMQQSMSSLTETLQSMRR